MYLKLVEDGFHYGSPPCLSPSNPTRKHSSFCFVHGTINRFCPLSPACRRDHIPSRCISESLPSLEQICTLGAIQTRRRNPSCTLNARDFRRQRKRHRQAMPRWAYLHLLSEVRGRELAYYSFYLHVFPTAKSVHMYLSQGYLKLPTPIHTAQLRPSWISSTEPIGFQIEICIRYPYSIANSGGMDRRYLQTPHRGDKPTRKVQSYSPHSRHGLLTLRTIIKPLANCRCCFDCKVDQILCQWEIGGGVVMVYPIDRLTEMPAKSNRWLNIEQAFNTPR